MTHKRLVPVACARPRLKVPEAHSLGIKHRGSSHVQHGHVRLCGWHWPGDAVAVRWQCGGGALGVRWECAAAPADGFCMIGDAMREERRLSVPEGNTSPPTK